MNEKMAPPIVYLAVRSNSVFYRRVLPVSKFTRPLLLFPDYLAITRTSLRVVDWDVLDWDNQLLVAQSLWGHNLERVACGPPVPPIRHTLSHKKKSEFESRISTI